MSFRNLLITFAAAATTASAATYSVRLNQPSVVNGHQFQPGVYRGDVDDSNQIAKIHDGQKVFFATMRPDYKTGGSLLRIGRTRWTVFLTRARTAANPD